MGLMQTMQHIIQKQQFKRRNDRSQITGGPQKKTPSVSRQHAHADAHHWANPTAKAEQHTAAVLTDNWSKHGPDAPNTQRCSFPGHTSQRTQKQRWTKSHGNRGKESVCLVGGWQWTAAVRGSMREPRERSLNSPLSGQNVVLLT